METTENTTVPTTARERMDAGLWYDANNDAELAAERLRAKDLCFEFNTTHPSDSERLAELQAQILPHAADGVEVCAPLQIDYGYNCYIGEGTFFNHGTYLMDGARITIGSHCYFGPSCGFYTASHPKLARDRNRGFELASPITIGDDVWFGGDVTVLPGVTIGSGAIIGAGSVVTRDVPPMCIAAGNPCRVIRELNEADALTDEDLGL
ncbi:MAG: sugar O-acetyltransferase [Coriobacteriia bacterium]|nr:sugar O-acetyltransferase [Coriobacteriia bacterium]